jgi:FkbM family methyltransferase
MSALKNLKKRISNLKFFDKFQISYSQEGEDLLIDRVLQFKKTGFYIDIGAYHPIKFSNTYKFYLKGWKGINIDAMPGSMAIFKRRRPRDINLETAVSNTSEIIPYHIFNEQALNTLVESEAKRKDGLFNFKLSRTENLKTKRLDEILLEYLPKGIDVDFLTVDVEGFDLKVLQSNDWDRIRPTLVLAESLSSYTSIEEALRSELTQFMYSLNYTLFAKTGNTLFFKDNTKNII